jgi:thioester reductase-like protein
VDPAAGSTPSPAELRSFLGGKLPEYMVPSAFVTLDALPLSANGKVDRKALPAPDPDRAEATSEFVPPATPTEERLAEIWADLLHVERVGARDSFFELGGHSLLAVQVQARVRDAFGVEVPLRRLFESPVLADFAAIVESAEHTSDATAGRAIDWRAEATLEPAIRADGLPPVGAGEPAAVLLTGATGYLGAFLLEELLRQTPARVVCLVRAADDAAAADRVHQNLERYGARAGREAGRIVPLAGDLARPLFGLTSDRFSRLAREVDRVYHNGAVVHFLHTYETLKPDNVLGTQEILRLATTARLKPVLYVSTMGVLAGLAHGRPAREDDRNDDPGQLDLGYSQSKWVAEQLVWEAGRRGVPVAVVRPGRIVWHSATGALKHEDLFTRALRACIWLGAVPALETELELTPVDYVAAATVAIGRKPDAWGKAYHLFNPRFVRLSDLLGWIRAAGHPVEALPPLEWLARVQEAGPGDVQDALAGVLPILAGGMATAGVDARGASGPAKPALDDHNARAALAGTGVISPEIDATSVQQYLAVLAESGMLDPPGAPRRPPAGLRNGKFDRPAARRPQGSK